MDELIAVLAAASSTSTSEGTQRRTSAASIVVHEWSIACRQRRGKTARRPRFSPTAPRLTASMQSTWRVMPAGFPASSYSAMALISRWACPCCEWAIGRIRGTTPGRSPAFPARAPYPRGFARRVLSTIASWWIRCRPGQRGAARRVRKARVVRWSSQTLRSPPSDWMRGLRVGRGTQHIRQQHPLNPYASVPTRLERIFRLPGTGGADLESTWTSRILQTRPAFGDHLSRKLLRSIETNNRSRTGCRSGPRK